LLIAMQVTLCEWACRKDCCDESATERMTTVEPSG